jgi:thioredoxin-related protein
MDFEIFVFAVDSEGRSVLDPYFEERPTSLPVLIDRYKVAAERYGVEKLPTVFLVNPEGTIVYKAEGYKPENIEAIKSFLDEAQEQ